jgi:hypothetical protein
MKHLKMFGLAAVAAVGLIAFVGSGIASATITYTDKAHTVKYPKGTKLTYSLKAGMSVFLKNTSGETFFTCIGSEIAATTEQESALSIESPINSMTWSGCSNTLHTVSNGKLSTTWSSGTNGEVTGSGSSWTYSMFGTSCTYGTGAGTKLGTITSGESPELAVNAVIPKVAGGFLCPSDAVWQGTWILTSPHAVYITK